MIVQVVQESPQEKIRIGGTKDCNNEFILLSAISLLVYVSKKRKFRSRRIVGQLSFKNQRNESKKIIK